MRRDWLIQSSYRIGMLGRLAHIPFLAASFFYLAKLVDPGSPPALGAYGGRYFPFVLLGLAFSHYLTTSLFSFSGNLREEQLQGTLEAMLATPTGIPTIVLGGVVWEFLWTTVEVACYLGLGALLFGVGLGNANIAAGVVLLALTVVSLSSLGVLAASGTLLFKEFQPTHWFLGGAMKLLGGVYFPVAVLPGWLKICAAAFPVTYGLEGLRQAVLMGRSLSELWKVCLALGAFILVLWPLALLAFSWTVRRLKTTGAMSFR